MAVLIVVLVLVALAVLYVVYRFNRLIRLRVRTQEAWSDIDVELKRRHDLIPNLVETVKGYASHEKGTFENIARYRPSPSVLGVGPSRQERMRRLGAGLLLLIRHVCFRSCTAPSGFRV